MAKMNKHKIIKDYEDKYLKKDITKFKVGDTVEVFVKIIEEDKKRVQVFTGIVLKKQGTGARKTFTVRKVSFGEGVERTFPLHSPNIDKIVISKKGNVKRAKLYYLREKFGKEAKIEGDDIYAVKAKNTEAAPREESPKEGA